MYAQRLRELCELPYVRSFLREERAKMDAEASLSSASSAVLASSACVVADAPRFASV